MGQEASGRTVLRRAIFPSRGGGFLGVEVFFTLSGFLITQLLVAELRRTGTVDAAAFVRARARRLLPALVVGVTATVLTYG
jgi:peptidoglycan/LPS O-acetylase OafA/YrhL